MAGDPNNAYRRTQTACLVLVTLVLIGFALAQLGPVLVPFVVAVLITYCLKPALEFQVRYLRFPRPLATVTTILLGMGILLAIGLAATAGITTIASNLGAYRDQLQQLLQQVAESVPLEALGLEINLETGMFVIPEQATQNFLTAILSETAYLLSNGTMIFIFMLFLLIGVNQPPADRPDLLRVIEGRVQRYLLVLVSVSVGTGILVGLTLHLLGIPFALLFGFLAFLLNFIPNIGSIVATLLPLPVILLEPNLAPHARILGLLLPAAIQFVVGNLLVPRLQGSALQLHPVTILLGIMFFGMIWGIAGAFLATPILAVSKITLERPASTRSIARLLEGDLRPLLASNATAEHN